MESRCKRRRLLDGDVDAYEYGEPAPLNLGRQIFLSHSGKDKDFVRFLHDELRKRYHYANIAFFDVETLPTAVAVSMENILGEARKSKLGVLVLTEDFFVHTPNPMRELAEFVAHKVPLLPLFFTMSVDEFREKKKSGVWEEQWRKWSGVDERVMNLWRDALNHVLTFSGLEYCKVATNQPNYIRKIVNKVTHIIPPAIKLSEEGVIGMDRLCKIVNRMYKKCALKRTPNDCTQVASSSTSTSLGSSGLTCVVGIYGFAGLGKTTLCKGLCDYYFEEFNGKVCYVDLGSKLFDQASSQIYSLSGLARQRVEHVLRTLTSYKGALQYPELSQVQNLLRCEISSQTDPVFLAIDNVLPELDSLNEAEFYLKCGTFPRDSKIFITARSRNILEVLGSMHSSTYSMVIEHIPNLKFKEAKNIFERAISGVSNFGSPNVEDEVEDEVNKCVNMCIIHEEWSNYHPLMLNSLATSIRLDTRRGSLKHKLEKLQSMGAVDKNNAWEAVFRILDITYNDMTEACKKVFLDLALFYHILRLGYGSAWIQSVYSEFDNIDGILSQLQDLAFISDNLGIHDSLLDFSMYKVSKGIFAVRYQGIPRDDYVVLEKVREPRWRSVRSVTISSCKFNYPTLNLRNVRGVEVLHLVDNAGLQQVLLSPSTFACLRSLIVRAPPGTSLCCTMVNDSMQYSACSGLKWFQLEGHVIINNTWPRQCRLSSNSDFQHSLQNLELTAASVFDLGALGLELPALKFLTLTGLPSVQSIDVNSCANLNSCTIENLPSLRSMCGLERSTNLEGLFIEDCEELVALTVPANKLMGSVIYGCGSLETLTLICTTSSSTSPAAAAIISANPESDSSTHEMEYGSGLNLDCCSNLRNIHGLNQYIGRLAWNELGRDNSSYLQLFQDLLDSAEVDSSIICKARVIGFNLARRRPAGLIAGVERMDLEDAQNIGPLISALFKAQPPRLSDLDIRCKEGGDCGCDKNAPLFGPLPYSPDHLDILYDSGFAPYFRYCCSQVRDLSSLSHWHQLKELDLSGCTSVRDLSWLSDLDQLNELNLSGCTSVRDLSSLSHLILLQKLDLSGCTSVELLPDLATMTSLEILDLSFCTSLKELWPAGVLLLPCLECLEMKGCTQFSAEEFMKSIILEKQGGICIIGAIESLMDDVRKQRRDSCSIVDALDSLLPELVARFHDAWHAVRQLFLEGQQSTYTFSPACHPDLMLIEFMYAVLFEEEDNYLISNQCTSYGNITKILRGIGWHKPSRWYQPNSGWKDRTIKLVKSFFEAPWTHWQSNTLAHWRSEMNITGCIQLWCELFVLKHELLAMDVAAVVFNWASLELISVHNIDDLVARLQQDHRIYKARFLSLMAHKDYKHDWPLWP